MKVMITSVLAAALCGPVFANTLVLTPANPQPAGLSKGLAVSYASGAGGRSLSEARSKLSRANPGKALRGLSYLDTDNGDKVLTSSQREKIAAAISGFIRFEKAGTYAVDFFTNDGLDISIGGQQVALADEVRSCDSTGVTKIKVPSAGWYALEATYFQRKGSACLMMDWNVGGAMAPVPDAVFGHAD